MSQSIPHDQASSYVDSYAQQGQRPLQSVLPVPLTCQTTYTATLSLNPVAGVSPISASVITIDKQVFNDPHYFNNITAYNNTVHPMNGSQLLISHDNVEARLALKAQAMVNACCDQAISKVTFHYLANAFSAGNPPSAFIEVISTEPLTLFNQASSTFDSVIQNALIGFFSTPLLFTDSNFYVIGFSATYVFTPLLTKRR